MDHAYPSATGAKLLSPGRKAWEAEGKQESPGAGGPSASFGALGWRRGDTKTSLRGVQDYEPGFNAATEMFLPAFASSMVSAGRAVRHRPAA